MKISEESKVQIYINGGYETTVICPLEAEIEDNSITMVNGFLLCTDYDCIKKIAENEYRLDTCLQDCIFAYDGKLYDSHSKVG
jgi:hypothetical protein